MFTKAINPNFEDNGRRKRLAGFIGTLTDESNIVIHSMEYRTYSEAEIRLDLLVHELLLDAASRGLVDTVPVCITCGNDGDCPDCDPSPGASEMAYQMLARATVLLNDCNKVITMALGQSHGAASVVAELHRVKEELDAAFA